jgi:hypothetical protein
MQNIVFPVCCFLSIRQHLIKNLDMSLEKIEADRMNEVRQIFMNYSQQLEKIAHLMQPNLQRLLDHESQVGVVI